MYTFIMLRRKFGRLNFKRFLNRINKRKGVASFLCATTIIIMIVYLGDPETDPVSDLELDIDPYLYTPIEPEVETDFPISPTANSTIPNTIHQIWNDDIIPTQLVENIKVLINKHPKWEYYFWTLDTGRLFIKYNFPRLVEIYDSYIESIDKSDLLRYAILYKYGGVFLDLDIYVLRPLDRIIASYPCVVVREPPEHAALLYNVELHLANGILFARPGHPLFRQILGYALAFKHKRPCGTEMFTLNVLMYYKTLEAAAGITNDSVYVAPSTYFLDDIDPSNHKNFRNLCKRYKRLDLLRQRGCASYKRRLVSRDINFRFTYSTHMWAHTMKKLEFDNSNSIRNIVPSAKIYTGGDDERRA